MTVSFNIDYRTNWGEEVRILGSVPELGAGDLTKALPLVTKDGLRWSADIEVSNPDEKSVQYAYCIFRGEELIRKEWSAFPRTLNLEGKNKLYRINDLWRDMPVDQYLYSSAFTECLFTREQEASAPQEYKKTIRLKAFAPRIGKEYKLGISGNQELLGNWDADKVLLLNGADFPEWRIELDAAKIKFPLEYKFVLYNTIEGKVESWEESSNRGLADPKLKSNETLVIADARVSFPLPAWKGAGVAIPVFSLRTEKSFGVGDFGDLKKMIDWAVVTSQRVVQILPINDTTMTHTWVDSYPYSSISIYAFNPIYADLEQLGKLKDEKQQEYFDRKQQEMNAFSVMDYEMVTKTKWEYFRLIYAQNGKKALASDEYRLFFESNKEWLQPYAAFSYLRDKHGTPDYRLWPEYSVYNSEEIDQLCHPSKPEYQEIAIYYYIQFNLHLQLLSATKYAREKGIVLKGDIPIGISRNSVEGWSEPYYFNMNGQAGAPPDDFSVNGQNWGLPTYNWDVMAKDGYSWWMKRFKKMSEYFDAYRIDHILGFFRIWEIPMHSVHGLLGQFVPSIPMSRGEIESYGLPFYEDFYLTPYIHEWFLPQMFGQHTDWVKETFLNTTNTWQVYRMKPEFDTQRKVEAYFQGKSDPDSIWIRDGLYALISDVLFIRDSKEPDKFHPRIGVQHDFIYQSLNDEHKAKFNVLYDRYFYHRHNMFWRDQAMQKLPQLTQSTRMLVCGEDLGMVPDSVAWVMNDLQILSLEIQRMPKDPSLEFGDLYHYPYRSVCTISTHDMSTFRGWWQEDRQQTQHYYNYILHREGEAPQVVPAEICEEVVNQHLWSNSMLCVLTLQDWLAIDGELRNPDIDVERINIPSNPKHYWRWRMHMTLEELIKADALNEKIRGLVKSTGRDPKN